MKLRLIATAILAFLVAIPVIATSHRFTDVPQDHEHRAAIDWAYGRGLFKGYPDRSFKPDRALSENELQIVVKRLFDSYDEITRSQTASILYYGITGLEEGPPTTTTTTTTTNPTTTRRNIETTTTTRYVSTTLAAPFSCSLPIGEVEHLPDDSFRFPIDNSECNIDFSVCLDAHHLWGTCFDVEPFETGYSRIFTWLHPNTTRVEITVFDYRSETKTEYEVLYYVLRSGGQTTTTTDVRRTSW